jgi:hypothetical protein
MKTTRRGNCNKLLIFFQETKAESAKKGYVTFINPLRRLYALISIISNSLYANSKMFKVERLARRIGLDCYLDEQLGSGGSVKTLIIAGRGLSIEIDFANSIVKTVKVTFPDSPAFVTKHADDAGQIFFRDLVLKPGESPLTKMLENFSLNLERLAALDKLSVMPQLNCHAAIAGIYESLKRLHEWELARLQEEEEMKGKKLEEIVKAVLCTKSGQPLMNARDNVGMNLDYWQERPKTAKVKASGSESSKEKSLPKIWSLLIECAPSSALAYPPVRVSEKWISEDIRKAKPTEDDLLMATDDLVLDWQDPENVLLPASATSKSEGAMEGIEQDMHTTPDVMFVAKFDPPLAVPYNVSNHFSFFVFSNGQNVNPIDEVLLVNTLLTKGIQVATQIYSATGASIPDPNFASPYDDLLFPVESEELPAQKDAAHRRIKREQHVTAFSSKGERLEKTHANILTIQKLEYGRVITSLPFSHPRQLVNLLPILRQYVRLSSLLHRTLGSEYEDTTAKKLGQPTASEEDEFETLMNPNKAKDLPKQAKKLSIDIRLLTQPHPQFGIVFALGMQLLFTLFVTCGPRVPFICD